MKERTFKLSWVITPIIGLVVGAILNYLASPAWTIRSTETLGLILILVILMALITGVTTYFSEDRNYIPLGIYSGIAILIVVIMGIGGLTGAKAFNASKYQSLVEIQTGNFEEEIPEAADVAVVDVGIAKMLGSRAIGAIQNSTYYEVDDEYNLIIYQGRQYRLSPLNYGGLRKYNAAKNIGIPGYILVDAVTQECKFVTLDKPIYYSPSAFFKKDLKRHLRSQYSNYIFGTSFFEIDEEGNPFWITSVQKPTIGLFGGKVEEEFIITNANDGESNIYTVEELPDWVDHAFDLEYLMNITQYNFKYIHGWINSWGDKTDVKKLSFSYKHGADTSEDGTKIKGFAGYNSTITKDGIMFFTGVTPDNKSESNIGFVLVSTRTGVVKYFDCAGAEESSAQAQAESLVQNFGYEATYPTIVNVNGIETYFMTLKGNDGTIKKYALCNVAEYTKVVQADTLEDAMVAYKKILGMKTEEEIPEDKIMSKEGTISSLTQAQISGYTYYYFKLDGENDIYMSSIENSNKQVFMKEGQKVSLKCVESSEKGILLVKKISF